MYKCEKCNKVLKNKQCLKRHLQRKRPCDYQNKCHICQTVFDTKQHLNNHLNRKTDCLEEVKVNQREVETFLVEYITLRNRCNEIKDEIGEILENNIELLSINDELLEKEHFFQNRVAIKSNWNRIMIDTNILLSLEKKLSSMEDTIMEKRAMIIGNLQRKNLNLDNNIVEWVKSEISHYEPWDNYLNYSTLSTEIIDILVSLREYDDRIVFYCVMGNEHIGVILWDDDIYRELDIKISDMERSKYTYPILELSEYEQDMWDIQIENTIEIILAQKVEVDKEN